MNLDTPAVLLLVREDVPFDPTHVRRFRFHRILPDTQRIPHSIQQSDSVGGPKVTEQVAISAAKFKFEYKAQKADGSLGPSQVFTFDCKANKAG